MDPTGLAVAGVTFKAYENPDDTIDWEGTRSNRNHVCINIDHVGNVAPCIEKIDRTFGNVRKESLRAIHARMKGLDEVARCQQCWTACRGYNTTLERGGSRRGWVDLATRMRST